MATLGQMLTLHAQNHREDGGSVGGSGEGCLLTSRVSFNILTSCTDGDEPRCHLSGPIFPSSCCTSPFFATSTFLFSGFPERGHTTLFQEPSVGTGAAQSTWLIEASPAQAETPKIGCAPETPRQHLNTDSQRAVFS